jgi:hypothetical protein
LALARALASACSRFDSASFFCGRRRRWCTAGATEVCVWGGGCLDRWGWPGWLLAWVAAGWGVL